MTWNNCPILVKESEYSPQRHLLPVVHDADIHEGDYVGLRIWGEMPEPINASPLGEVRDLWVINRVGIAMEDAAVGQTVKVRGIRDGEEFWVWKFKVAAKYLQPHLPTDAPEDV